MPPQQILEQWPSIPTRPMTRQYSKSTSQRLPLLNQPADFPKQPCLCTQAIADPVLRSQKKMAKQANLILDFDQGHEARSLMVNIL
jgi:hypothetical protein